MPASQGAGNLPKDIIMELHILQSFIERTIAVYPATRQMVQKALDKRGHWVMEQMDEDDRKALFIEVTKELEARQIKVPLNGQKQNWHIPSQQELYDDYEQEHPHEARKRKREMRKNHIISLLQKDFTTIGVKYEGVGSEYTYKAHETANVKEGDHVIVEMPQSDKIRRIFKVALVTRVDEQADIDTDSNYDYKWIVQVVSTTKYDATLKQEEKFSKELARLERAEQRQQVFDKFSAALPKGTNLQLAFDKVTGKAKKAKK